MVATPKAWKHVFFFAEGQGGIPKSAGEQEGNKTFFWCLPAEGWEVGQI